MKAFGDVHDLVRVRPFKPDVDFKAYEDSISGCSTMAELKSIWTQLPQSLKQEFTEIKNETKKRIENESTQHKATDAPVVSA